MLNGVQVTENSDDLGHIVLRVYDGEFSGCEYFYDKVTFPDAPNDDGTMNMSFEYTITNGYVVPEGRVDAFNRFIGDNLVKVMTDAMETQSAVYAGGVGGEFDK